MHSFVTYLSLLLLLFPALLSSSHAHPPTQLQRNIQSHVRFPPIQHYHNLIRRRLAPNNTTEIPPARNEKNTVDKRAGNARFTRYAAGLGACGGHNKDSDFIVALNQPQWDGGSHCYETITITYNDKSVQAQIVDKCVGCPSNALDLSNGLFAFLAPGQDMTYGDWSFGSSTPSKTPPPLPESTTSSSSKSKSSSSSSFNFSSTLASMTTTAAAAAETRSQQMTHRF